MDRGVRRVKGADYRTFQVHLRHHTTDQDFSNFSEAELMQ
jgi:hypothetical protein